MHSERVSVIYLFNLVVGAGALALPQAFALTGWALGIIAVAVLGTVSFVTSTFMVEAMSIANAVLRQKNPMIQQQNVAISEDHDQPINCTFDEKSALLQSSSIDSRDGRTVGNYEIIDKVEMGEMARIFFNNLGQKLFFIVIAIYLYGDLAIYAAAVPKSLTLVTCLNLKNATSSAFHGNNTCFKSFSVGAVYRFYVFLFTLIMGPFAFFDLGKTKYLQYVTTLFRWLAFLLMISLAIYHIKSTKKKIEPKLFDFSQLPNFFGVSVYSFMCQHSLPSILTPTENKRRLTRILSTSFIMVTSFYLLLTITAIFCFPQKEIVDIYTNNFFKFDPVFAYFLALFPVFTLSTSFPIIAITLRENLKTIFICDTGSCSVFMARIVFPLATVVPPVAIAFVTHNVELLVGFTGAYAGALIQYVVPVMLVYCGRRQARKLFGVYVNKHRSFFKQRSWIFAVLAWTALCIGLVTSNYIIQALKK